MSGHCLGIFRCIILRNISITVSDGASYSCTGMFCVASRYPMPTGKNQVDGSLKFEFGRTMLVQFGPVSKMQVPTGFWF